MKKEREVLNTAPESGKNGGIAIIIEKEDIKLPEIELKRTPKMEDNKGIQLPLVQEEDLLNENTQEVVIKEGLEKEIEKAEALIEKVRNSPGTEGGKKQQTRVINDLSSMVEVTLFSHSVATN